MGEICRRFQTISHSRKGFCHEAGMMESWRKSNTKLGVKKKEEKETGKTENGKLKEDGCQFNTCRPRLQRT